MLSPLSPAMFDVLLPSNDERCNELLENFIWSRHSLSGNSVPGIQLHSLPSGQFPVAAGYVLDDREVGVRVPVG
jgi:hypothetical protein